MHRILLAPVCLIAFACQSSQPVTRDNRPNLFTLLSTGDAASRIQHFDLDDLVAGASATASDFPATASPAALTMDDRRMAPLVTAINAIDTSFSVCANNLANAKTTAFKRSRVNFEDIYYMTIKQPGTTTSNGDVSPTGIQVGLGVRVSNTQLDTEQGSMENTGRQLDVGIQGQGFFKVKILATVNSGDGYSRNGNFFVNKDGDLVLGMGDGYKLNPKINIPAGSTDVAISADGKVSITKAGATAPIQVGQLQLFQFINPQGLSLLGGSIYAETTSSGPALSSKPGENGAGQVLQGYLEGSNVDPAKERLNIRFLQHWRASIMQVINDAK